MLILSVTSCFFLTIFIHFGFNTFSVHPYISRFFCLFSATLKMLYSYLFSSCVFYFSLFCLCHTFHLPLPPYEFSIIRHIFFLILRLFLFILLLMFHSLLSFYIPFSSCLSFSLSLSPCEFIFVSVTLINFTFSFCLSFFPLSNLFSFFYILLLSLLSVCFP